MTDALKRARELACQHYYGAYSNNRLCCSAACKNASHGAPDYLCQICTLQQAIAAALDAWAQEARLEEAKWWFEQYCPTEDPRAYERIAALEQRTGESEVK